MYLYYKNNDLINKINFLIPYKLKLLWEYNLIEIVKINMF